MSFRIGMGLGLIPVAARPTPTSAPVNNIAPSIGTILTQGQTLTANPGSWSGLPSGAFGYQWQRWNGSTWGNISGATSQTYVAQAADVSAGANGLRVAVTATNDLGSSTANSAGVTIAAPLSITGSPSSPSVGSGYSFIPGTTGGHTPKSFMLTGTLPSGLGFSTTNGEISGTPTTTGTASGLSITVTDADGLTAVLGPFSLTVDAAGDTPAWLLGLELLSDEAIASSQSIDGHVFTQSNGCHLRIHYNTSVIGTLTSWDASKLRLPNVTGKGFDPDGTPNDAVPRVLEVHGIGRPYRPYPEGDDAGSAKYIDSIAGAGYIDIVLSQRLYNDVAAADYTARTYKTSTGTIVFEAGFLNGTSDAGTAPESLVVRSDSLTYAEIGPTTFKHLLDIYPRVPANGTLDIEWEVGSWFPQQGQPVACLEAWTWNGTTAGTVVRASSMTECASTAGLTAPSGHTLDVMKTTLSFNGLAHGELGVRARAKPWEGPAVESVNVGDDFATRYTQNLFKTFPVYHDLNGDRYDIYGKVDPVGGRTTANKAGIFTDKASALADQGFTTMKLVADSAVLYNSDSTIKGVGKTHDTCDGPLHVVLPTSSGSLGDDAGSYCIESRITAKTGYFPIIIESEAGVPSNGARVRGRTRAGGSIDLTTKTPGPNTKRLKLKGLRLENYGTSGDDRTVIYGGGADTSGSPSGANAYYWSVEDCDVLGETAGASRFPLDATQVLYLRRNRIHNNRYRTGWGAFAGAIHSIGNKMTGDTNVDGLCSLADWMTDGEVTGAGNNIGNQVSMSQGSSPRSAPNITSSKQFFIHNSRYDTWNFGGIGACNDPPGRAKDVQLRYWAGVIHGGRYDNSNNTLIDFSDDLITPGTERNLLIGITTAGMPLAGVDGVGFMRTNGWYNDNGWVGANKTAAFRFSYITAIPMKGSWFNGNAAFTAGPGVANPPSVWNSSDTYYPADPVYDASGGLLPQTGAPTAQARQFKPDGTKIEFVPPGTPMSDANYWYFTGSNVTGHQANRTRNMATRNGVDSYCVLRSDSYYPSEPLFVDPTGPIADFVWAGSFEISPGVSSFLDVDTSTLYENDPGIDGGDPTVANFRPKAGSPLIGRRPPECRWDTRDPLGQARPTDSYGAAGALELIPDTTPAAFSFTDQTDRDPSTVYTSASVDIVGINTPTTISVTGGEYSINGGVFTSSPGTFPVGGAVRARVTSSSSPSTAVNCVVTIGGVSDTFTVTTAASGAPPSVSVAPALSGLNAGGTADIGQAVTTSNGTWTGSPTGYTYQWQRYTGSWANIAGQTTDTYTPTVADTQAGTKLRCNVTATNSNGSTTAASNAPDVFHPYQIAVAFWDLEDTTKVTVAGGKVTAWVSGGTAATPITASEVAGSGVTYSATAINSRPGITGNATSMYLEALSTLATTPGAGSQDLTSLPAGSTPAEFFALLSNADSALNTRGIFGYSADTTSNVRDKSIVKASVSSAAGLSANGGTGTSTIQSNKGPLTGRQLAHVIYTTNSVEARLNGVAGSTPTPTTLNGLARRLRIMASPVNVSTNPANYGTVSLSGVGVFPGLTSGQRSSMTYWGYARLGL